MTKTMLAAIAAAGLLAATATPATAAPTAKKHRRHHLSGPLVITRDDGTVLRVVHRRPGRAPVVVTPG